MAKKPTKDSTAKQLAKKGRDKIAAALAHPSPIGGLDHAAFTYAMHRSMGKSQADSLRMAQPEWDNDAIRSNAYLWDRRPDIQRAMQHMMEGMHKAKEGSIIASVEEVLTFLTRGIREPLSALGDNDPLVVEHTTTVNSNGSSEKIKKVDPLQCAKSLLEHHRIMAGLDGGGKIGDMSKDEFLGMLRKPGLPQATDKDFIDVESEMLEQ